MSILNDLKERFNKKPIVIRILYIALILSFIYDIISGMGPDSIFSVIFLLIVISELINWLMFTGE